ncbi:MAG: DUF484 family protein [Methylococcales bacterium]|nr:DUF484 family protein [Methylococcales bacterium]
MTINTADLSAAQVEVYLQQNPDFFHEHLNLLEQLSVPHPSGTAISLISKQLELFRGKHLEMESQLNALIEIARDNDTSFIRMHKLTLALLEAASLEQALANLDSVLSEYFLTDYVAVRIIKQCPEPAIPNLFIEPGSEDLQPFLRELSGNQPKCGRPTLAQAKVLFGDAAAKVRSCAIIPMNFTELEGILAIGSREEDRFHYSMGNLFLTHISEIIGTRLISLLRQQDHAG